MVELIAGLLETLITVFTEILCFSTRKKDRSVI
jgi:hypothetical protein